MSFSSSSFAGGCSRIVRRLMGSTICTYLIIAHRVLMFTYVH
nr:MAG TPA: hypothetical protein [Caudoviricetes sp.]